MKTKSILAKGFYITSAYVCFVAYQNKNDDFITGVIIPAVLAGVLAMIGSYFDTKQKAREQEFRDERANGILQMLQAGKPTSSYFLYLRPFVVDKKLFMKNPEQQFGVPFSPSYWGDGTQLEEILANALEKEGLLLSLGEPGDKFGAAQLPTDDGIWKDTAELLIRNARKIFAIPGYQAGIAWEIDLLKKIDGIDRCIFILPDRTDSEIAIDEYVSKTKIHFKSVGLEFPIVEPGGVAFCLNKDGSIYKSHRIPLDMGDEQEWRKAINDLRD